MDIRSHSIERPLMELSYLFHTRPGSQILKESCVHESMQRYGFFTVGVARAPELL